MRLNRLLLLPAAIALTACERPDGAEDGAHLAAAGLGRCTMEEPALPTNDGQAVYYLDYTRTEASRRIGQYAAMLTCVTRGPSGSSITVILPNLSDSIPAAGRYRVQTPGVVPADSGLELLAWAEAQIPASAGTLYRGAAGEVIIQADPTGALVGSYLVALERAPESDQRGPRRLVLGGAFAAPRNTLDPATALPRVDGR